MKQHAFFWKEREIEVFDGLYDFREDSQLLAESASIPKNAIVLDLGCGCGIQGFNALWLGAQRVLAADMDSKAIDCAAQNAKRLGFTTGQWGARKSDLFESIPERFDAILFNPPYLPTEGPHNLALDGGKNGREVLDKFLQTASQHVNPNGTIFFIHSSLNGWEKTEQLLKKLRLRFEIVGRKKLFFEELIVVRAKTPTA